MPKNIVVKPGIEKMPLQRLEPCRSKDPCTVLRGLGAGMRRGRGHGNTACQQRGRAMGYPQSRGGLHHSDLRKPIWRTYFVGGSSFIFGKG